MAFIQWMHITGLVFFRLTVFDEIFPLSLQVTNCKIYRSCVKLYSEYSFLDIRKDINQTENETKQKTQKVTCKIILKKSESCRMFCIMRRILSIANNFV